MKVKILLHAKYIILKLQAFLSPHGAMESYQKSYAALVIFGLLISSDIFCNEQAILKEIDDQYLSQVKPLIENNCLSCHGNNALNPWYRDIPLFKNYINSQIGTAKEKLDMGAGVPFQGNGKQSDIFWSISQSIKLNKMPPKDFSFMHQNLELSEPDKIFLINWFRTKRKILLENDI